MAYNNYFPVTYQPYQQGFYNPYNQQQMQMAQQPQNTQPQMSQNSIIWVTGENEAAGYPVAPNNAVTLWSQSEPVVYLKSADATGKPTMKIYDLVERMPMAQTAPKSSAIDYATKDDLGKVASVVKSFDELIAGIKSDVDGMKAELYGDGKRRTVKRTEVADNG